MRSELLSAFPSWLPLYLCCVIAATLFPFWVHCAPRELDLGSPVAFDVAQNVLLFWPLGIALRRRSCAASATFALLFSGALELGQLWVLRNPSPWDVLANTLGATLGWRTARCWRGRWSARPVVFAALVGTCLLLGVSHHAAPRRLGNGFEDWAPMSLVIGNELSLDRPWRGRIAELAVFDRAAPEAKAWDAFGPLGWNETGSILWLRFERPASGRIDGPAGARFVDVQPPAGSDMQLHATGLEATGGLWRLPDEVGRHVFERLTARGQLAVYGRFSPASLDVEGPGRILSFSRGLSERGFTLGQSGSDLVFRVRTPVTSDNGTRPNARTSGGPLGRSEHRVWATYDGFRSRIEVDGVCRGERILAAKRGVGPLGEMLGLTLAAGSGLSAFAAAGLWRRAPGLARTAAGLTAAALFTGALWSAGAWQHLPFFGPWAATLSTIAAGLGVRAGLGSEPRATRPVGRS